MTTLGPVIQIRIDPESGCAAASIAPRAEGFAILAKDLEDLCHEAGVLVTDSVRAEIEMLINDFNANPRAIDRTIAHPVQPVRGDDGYIEWFEGYDPTICQGPISEGDRVDHYAGCAFIRVSPDTRVGRLHLPTAGTEGCDVSGKSIKATPGKPCATRIDAVLTVDGDGNIVAQQEGALTIKRGALTITKLLEVREHVDFSTGHINFDGCVDIREEVRDLFQIKATGNVSVGGLIEAASIGCGGDFVGRRGMAGRGRGSLTVEGNAEIGFLNDMNGTIQGTLAVRREIINCDLCVNGGLACESCTLIGGTLKLRGKSVIGTLGSSAYRPTRIVLDADANLIVSKVMYPQVSLQIGTTVYQIDRLTKGPIRIVADGARSLAYRIADGVPRPLKEISKALREAA